MTRIAETVSPFYLARSVGTHFDSLPLDPLSVEIVQQSAHLHYTHIASLATRSTKSVFHAFSNLQSPVLRDFEAFLTVLEEDFKNVRVMAPLDAVFSGPEVAAQVLKTLQEEMGNVDEPTWRRERPFAMIYLDSHLQRVRNGVSKAIL